MYSCLDSVFNSKHINLVDLAGSTIYIYIYIYICINMLNILNLRAYLSHLEAMLGVVVFFFVNGHKLVYERPQNRNITWKYSVLSYLCLLCFQQRQHGQQSGYLHRSAVGKLSGSYSHCNSIQHLSSISFNGGQDCTYFTRQEILT